MAINEIRNKLELIDNDFRLGELFSYLDWLDENANDLNKAEQTELKQLLKNKKDMMLWCDMDSMISYRNKEKISKKRFWWWIDKL